MYKKGETSVTRANKTFALLVTTAVIAFGYTSTASGETYYRWVDDRGQPVHSDRPPPKGTEYEVVSTDTSLIRSVEADAGAVPKKVTSTPSNEFEPVETKQVSVEKNPEYCDRAKANLQSLDTSARVRLRDDQGEYRYIDEEEKATQRQLALDAIESYCN